MVRIFCKAAIFSAMNNVYRIKIYMYESIKFLLRYIRCAYIVVKSEFIGVKLPKGYSYQPHYSGKGSAVVHVRQSVCFHS